MHGKGARGWNYLAFFQTNFYELLGKTEKKKNKGIHWVQHDMTAVSQQWLPPAQVLLQIEKQGCHGCGRIVVGLITTYAISDCHH